MTQTTLPHLLARPEDIPASMALGGPVDGGRFLLDGRLAAWTGPMQEVRSPLFVPGRQGPERALLGHCPDHDAGAGEAALEAACAAWDQGLGAWPALPPEARMECVAEFCRRMRDKRAEVVRLMVWEICKPLRESEREFDRTIQYMEDTLAELRGMLADPAQAVRAGGMAARLDRSPLGVVLCLGPFNFPLNETLATLIPALLMGNTAVVKLPRIGRLLFTPLLECFQAAFPPGVVNILSGGIECARPALSSGKADVLAFIGTSRGAEALRALHPSPLRLRCVLGLEAKNAAIVLPGADLERAVPEIVRGALGFNGQRCTALKLVFAAKEIAGPLLERLAGAVGALRPGLPWTPGVQITPLPEPGKPRRLNELLQDALDRGAKLLPTGAPAGPLDETLFAPALVSPVTPDMRLFHEEQFGPILPVALFDDAEDLRNGPLRALARSDYGQQASLFGADPAQLSRLSALLRNLVSRVNINCKCQRGPDMLPFTARRGSAVGTLSVREGLLAFSLPTLAVARDTERDAPLLDSLRLI